MLFIRSLQNKYGCPVINSGDSFDHWKPSPLMLSWAMEYLPNKFQTIYGNHDLPQHNLEFATKSGLNTLEVAKKLTILTHTHWGRPLAQESLFVPIEFDTTMPHRLKIAVWHVMTWRGKVPWPGCEDLSAIQILAKYPDYGLIVTGHNHKTFIEEYKGRLLVNPGSLTRQDADQVDHKPCVFLWYAKANEVEQVFIPIEQGVISREHIEHKKEHDTRIEAFVERLNTSQLKGFDFKNNLELFERENKVRKSVMEIVWRAIDNQ